MNKQSVVAAIVRQFADPRGMGGNLAGWVMAHRSSNRRRNAWVVGLLDVRPTDRVLEIGFGPGLAIARLSRLVGPRGQVRGVDRSAVMFRQASRRNAAAIRAGRVTLVHAPVDSLPPAVDGPFDVMLTVNSLAFWPDATQRLADLWRRLAPGGRIAVASQPRGVTVDPTRAADELAELLRAAGFVPTRTERLDLDPPVVCVIATKS